MGEAAVLYHVVHFKAEITASLVKVQRSYLKNSLFLARVKIPEGNEIID